MAALTFSNRITTLRDAIVNRNGVDSATRLAFIDNIRVLLTLLVIAHHAAQPYGPTGGEWPVANATRAMMLGPFFAVNAAFFMGLFFLISGYFLPRAYDRKGAGAFLKDRLLRLGIPLLVTAFVLFGPITYLEYAEQGQLGFWQFFLRVYVGEWRVEVAHLWFLAHLLFYAVCYTLWRQVGHHAPRANRADAAAPGHLAILMFALGLAIITFIVRIWYPVNRWVQFLGIIPAEFAHVPQYLSLFIIGIAAYRHDWFRKLPARTGMAWLWVGGLAAVARYAYTLAGQNLLPSILAPGGLDWRSLVWSTWEALICIGLCAGLLTLFREKVNRQGKLLRALSANAYAVYIIHVWIVVGLQFALADVSLHPLAKFAIVTLAGIPLCFLISPLIRKLPLARSIL